MDIIDTFIAPACHETLDVLYQDEAILLINKPSGLLSLSGKNPLNLDSVHFRLANGRLVNGRLVNGQPAVSPSFPHARLPHRLDFGTSGIMVVALTPDATVKLNKQFQDGTVQKHYTAMLEGWVSADEGVINAPIAKDNSQFPRVKICQRTGKTATSKFKVLQRLTEPRRSLVQFTPLSGRTHQLRIHSLSIGHPILGCDLYHSDSSQQLANRLLLHASDIYFEHPVTGAPHHGHCTSPF
ncbi:MULTISPECIES: RluA family pseudouridine synthase [unclassified Arsukibacterium]|uniref:RluA family pseudouridine synthase n=1 Tax=unclassified Arsukibacterium TaxID=2635278 RepID=UPI000C50785C|nr:MULTISPECIES: RluA family pseudouridine synthase [unclassified Arsukibacterium]MAA93196.1 RNA pseudouridine synthase [Rheinheimera sp.]MBM35202.1 RNA pseudouridine synthase [Rheinheimera sp.]HAW94083.1 RNA pseudouridine synthase [Candidatus Azambacteria bacterium]